MDHSLTVFTFVKGAPDGRIESIWNVKPSGDFDADFKRGGDFAGEVLREIPNRSAGLIAQIVQGMPRKLTVVEHGFFQTLNFALQA